MGVQCGGWSTGWRGHRGAITPGTTIRQGLTEAVGAGRLDFSKDGAGAERADVVVVVVGEDPYAEGGGDRADQAGATTEDRALIDAVKRTGKPMVIVLLSRAAADPGRHRRRRRARSWPPGCPGTEGAGVADVLSGAVKPTGKLPAPGRARWRTSRSTSATRQYEPLFAYGYGLSW